ncbi:ribosome silencing factor [Bombilactobacillus folatiphilus]|uniref:Ribosomal silencing factor RsfS n=1 Tax=Bombilactobacillus folatiphilus TaxID=2923362 RepID=A0ABY4PAI1_9LACO|nr:ribosome silencing factor [Bombilactobacillus folatiphilus]UQS82546.1 ribosome silencing factor [Bombilactobacillus folatiphilus]
MKSQQVMELAVKAADAKHANEIQVLDMQQVSLIADYFVIADANSQRQIAAIVDQIVETAVKKGIHASVEGQKNSQWILVDLGDVIVHVFTREMREYYQLEKLWSDAKAVEIQSLVAD